VSNCRAGAASPRRLSTPFAERLAALGEVIQIKGVTECEKIVGCCDTRAIEKLLSFNGIGPVVLRNFFLLRGI
jgi:hypothetical protein